MPNKNQIASKVEDLLHTIGATYPALAPLATFHTKKQLYIPDLAPADLAEAMATVFAELQERVVVLLDLLRALFHTTFEKESAASTEGDRSDG